MAAIATVFATIWFLAYYCTIIMLILEGYTESATVDDAKALA